MQVREDHPRRKYPPSNRSSEKQSLLINATFVQYLIFLLERKLEKILHLNPTNPSGELLLRAEEISSPLLARSPLINIA